MIRSRMADHPSTSVAPVSWNGHAPSTAATQAEHVTHSTEEVHHLVLDDDPTICRLIQSGLARPYFTIDAVSDAAAMEAQLRAKPYHLVLLDYIIPGLEAEQVLGWLREYQPDAAVIVMTAYPSLDGALHCLRARTYDYLSKPFAMELLERTVTPLPGGQRPVAPFRGGHAGGAGGLDPGAPQGSRLDPVPNGAMHRTVPWLPLSDRVRQEFGLD